MEFESFNYGDTIIVSAAISHIKTINNISISVTDEELKPVISGKQINPQTKEITVESFLIVDNKYIEQGKHYLHLQVADDDNVFNFWYTVSLMPLERNIEKVFIITGSTTVNTLKLITSQGTSETYYSWNSEYLGGYIDSKYRNFYSSGSLIDGVRAYSIDQKELRWSVPAVVGGNLPYFTSFNASDGFVNTAIWKGYIDVYNNEGNKTFTSTSFQNGKFIKSLKTKDFVCSILKSFDNQPQKLVVFNYPAGNVYYSSDLNGTVLFMSELDDQNILILVSDNEVTKSWQFNPTNKSLIYLHDVTDIRVNAVTGSDGDYFIAADNSILWYRPQIASTVNYINVSNAQAITYSKEENDLFIEVDGKISVYHLPSLAPETLFQSDQQVKDILILYNK